MVHYRQGSVATIEPCPTLNTLTIRLIQLIFVDTRNAIDSECISLREAPFQDRNYIPPRIRTADLYSHFIIGYFQITGMAEVLSSSSKSSNKAAPS